MGFRPVNTDLVKSLSKCCSTIFILTEDKNLPEIYSTIFRGKVNKPFSTQKMTSQESAFIGHQNG